MYKTLTKKILNLNDEKEKAKKEEIEKIKDKIKKYETERIKIRSMFPEKFFDSYLEDK